MSCDDKLKQQKMLPTLQQGLRERQKIQTGLHVGNPQPASELTKTL